MTEDPHESTSSTPTRKSRRRWEPLTQRVAKRRAAAKRSTPRVGSVPGQLIIREGALAPKISYFGYGAGELVEEAEISLERLGELLETDRKHWINVEGLGDAEILHGLQEMLTLHPLALEDAVHTFQRAKAEAYDNDLFLIARMPQGNLSTTSEQTAFFVRPELLLTLQEQYGDCWDPVRDRVRNPDSRIRRSGGHYLAYALLDALIDSYFPVLTHYEDLLDELEEQVLKRTDEEVLQHIHKARRDLLKLYRTIMPHTQLFLEISRVDGPVSFPKEVQVFLRDALDHTTRLVDMVETDREFASSLVELHISYTGYRANEVMKVLTIIATIFIPLSFIAGLYGMNFDTNSPFNMPELSWEFGYFVALGLMAATAGGLLWFFRRKGWI